MLPDGNTKWDDLLSSAISQSKHIPTHTFAQLATIRSSKSGSIAGRPSCRTINIRAFRDTKCYFSSDTRSRKADDVTEGPSSYAELCWYFPTTSQQFRLSGRVNVLSSCEASAQAWDKHTERERVWWGWPEPANNRAPDDVLHVAPPTEEPPNFCVCELVPDHVDLIDLSVVPFLRELHDLQKPPQTAESDPQWIIKKVNP